MNCTEESVNINSYFKIVIISIIFILQGCASSEEFIRPNTDLSNFKRLGILPLNDSPSAKGSGIIVADFISMILMGTNLSIVDRSQTSMILAEQKLGLSGIILEDTAPIVGKVLGVQALFTGSVSNWSCETSNIQIVQGAQPSYMTSCSASLTIKLIDAESGQILWSGSARGSQLGAGTQSDAAMKAVKNLMKKFMKHY